MNKLVLRIENGELKESSQKELEKENEYYRVEGEHWIVVDYDKNKARPIFKDLLNRMGTFLEIKYLFWITIVTTITMIASIIGAASIFFDTSKKLDAIFAKVQERATIESARDENGNIKPIQKEIPILPDLLKKNESK